MAPAVRLNSKAGAMILSGLVFWVVSWALDMWTHVETFGVNAGAHAHGGTALLRVTIPVTGFPLILIGLGMIIGTDGLMRRGGVPLMLASFFMMTDGLLHAFAFNDHLGSLASAAFFAFVAPLQIAAGIAIPFVGRRYDRPMLAGTFGLLALYAVSRLAPIAALGWPEPVESLDVFSKACELLFVISLVMVMKAGTQTPKADAPASAAAAGSAP